MRLSKLFDAQFGSGVVSGAVIGTFAAFAGTLAAYKVFDIQVGAKFKMFVMAAVFGMVGLSLMELVLGLFGAQLGLFGFGALGLVFAVVGLVLGVFMLVMDFDFVEQGIRNGLARERVVAGVVRHDREPGLDLHPTCCASWPSSATDPSFPR